MAISVATSTQVDSTSNPRSTASMTVADDDIVVIAWAFDANSSPATLAITKSAGTATVGTAVNVNSQESGGQAGISYIEVTGGGTLTLQIDTTITIFPTRRFQTRPLILTGVDLTDIVGVSGVGTSSTNNLTTAAITVEQTGSLVVWVGNEWNDLGTPTSSDLANVDADNGGGASQSYIAGTRDGVAGSMTANLDASGAAAADWDWAAVEFRAATGGGANDPYPDPQRTILYGRFKRDRRMGGGSQGNRLSKRIVRYAQTSALPVDGTAAANNAAVIVLGALWPVSATQLVVQDATSASTVDNVALTQHHVLAVADATLGFDRGQRRARPASGPGRRRRDLGFDGRQRHTRDQRRPHRR